MMINIFDALSNSINNEIPLGEVEDDLVISLKSKNQAKRSQRNRL